MDRYSKKDGTKEEEIPLLDSDKNANKAFFRSILEKHDEKKNHWKKDEGKYKCNYFYKRCNKSSKLYLTFIICS